MLAGDSQVIMAEAIDDASVSSHIEPSFNFKPSVGTWLFVHSNHAGEEAVEQEVADMMVNAHDDISIEEVDADLTLDPLLFDPEEDVAPSSPFHQRVREKVVETVNRGAQRVTGTFQQGASFVEKKWAATDVGATRSLHTTKEIAVSKSKVVSETVTAKAESVQQGMSFVRTKSQEVLEPGVQRMQQGLGYAKEKSEPLQRGFGYAKERTGQVTEHVQKRVGSMAESVKDQAKDKTDRASEKVQKSVDFVAAKAETVKEQAKDKTAPVTEKMQKGVDFVAATAEAVKGQAKDKTERASEKMQRGVEFVSGKAEAVSANASAKAQAIKEVPAQLSAKAQAMKEVGGRMSALRSSTAQATGGA